MEQSIITKYLFTVVHLQVGYRGTRGRQKIEVKKKKQIKNISFLNAGRHTINYIRQAI